MELTAQQCEILREAKEQSQRLKAKYFRHIEVPGLNASAATLTIEDLRRLAELQEIVYARAFSSHRPIIGPFIIALKSLSSRLINKVLRIFLARQMEVNQGYWNVALSVFLLEQRVQVLEERLRQCEQQKN